ncbi:hypothetical protein DRQ18_08140 [bacterium]|nr:MAG: hypothetical protein DRQ18_08140 [bacterium]
MAGGVVALVVGLVLWTLNLTGYGFRWSRDWPLLIALFGIYELVTHIRREKRKRPVDVRSVLKELEEGKIDAQEALKRIEKGGKK